MRIDAHQHFWRLDRGDYGWLSRIRGINAIRRDFSPGDLLPHLEAHGIDATILVQAAPTEAETRFLLELADAHDFVAGVVGWADFDAPDAADRIAALAGHPLLVGFRPMVQDIPDDDWLARESHAPAFEAIIAHGLVFDALVLPRHLPRLLAVLERHPDLPVVVDHAAKPPIATGVPGGWFRDIAAVAEHPQTACKLSGLVTEAGADWTVDDLAPVVAPLLARFGPDRILWGSDWPVLNLAADYGRWWETTRSLLAGRTDEERDDILGGAAARIYLRTRGRKPSC